MARRADWRQRNPPLQIDRLRLRMIRPANSEQPLCGLGIRGAALEPASDENINTRGKSQLSRCQRKPRVQALIEWSFDIVAGVHLALLPVRRRERPCAGSYTLALRISPASS